MGAAWGDYDGDGRPRPRRHPLRDEPALPQRGQGPLPRRLRGDAASAAARASGPASRWADYDRDGDLDLYVCGYVRYRYDPAKAGETSRQFKAVVPFTLNPSSYPAGAEPAPPQRRGRLPGGRRARPGVDNPTGRSLSASWCDFDGDGWPDLYVANDVSDNAMFRNLGNGRFRDISHSAWVADYRGAMGLGVGDWDNDGDFDIFVTHWIAQENALYADETPLDEGDARRPPCASSTRPTSSASARSPSTSIGWGTGFFDFDNDGRLDLFAVNGSTFQEEADPAQPRPHAQLPLLERRGERASSRWAAGRAKPFADAERRTRGELRRLRRRRRSRHRRRGSRRARCAWRGTTAATGAGWVRLVLRASPRPDTRTGRRRAALDHLRDRGAGATDDRGQARRCARWGASRRT